MAQLANLTTTLAIESASFVNGIEQSRGAVRRLVASLDPAAAAQAKFNRQMDLAERGLKSGQLSADLYERVVARLRSQLDATTGAGGRLVEQSGSMRAGFQQLGYQLGDISQGFAMGTSAATIFAQQSGQVIQSLQLMTTETKGVLAFLGSPWGAVMSAALVALTPFVSKIFQGNDAIGDAVEKLKQDAQQSRITADAKKAFATTIEGLTEAIDAQNEALKKSAQTEQDAANQANIDAKNRMELLQVRRAEIAAELAYQQSVLQTLRIQSRGTGPQADTALMRLPAQEGTVNGLQTTLGDIDAAVTKANEAISRTRVALADLSAKRATDPIQRINAQFDGMKESAIAAAVATGKVTSALTVQLASIERQRQAALKAAEAVHSATNDNRQTGREISLPEAEAIVKSIGGTITSATRSFAQQSALYAKYLAGTGSLAAKPGHSDHELGNALDIAKTPGMTIAKIREAFNDAGVAIKQLLDEGNHFHVAWRTGASSAIQASKDEAAAIKLVRDASTGAYKAVAGLQQDQHKELTQLFAADAKAWDQVTKTASTAFSAGQEQRLADEHDLQQTRLNNIRDVAGFYRDLFDGGTKRIWQDFESIGFDVISKLLAKWTMNAVMPSNGGVGFFGAIANAFGLNLGQNSGAISSWMNGGSGAGLGFGGGAQVNLPGFATGGSFEFGGMSGVDRNILSLNGSPIAKVSKGERASIGRGGGGAVYQMFDLRGAVMTEDLLAEMNMRAAAAANAVVNDNNKMQVKRAGRQLGRR